MHKVWTFETRHGHWAIARSEDGRWHPTFDGESLGSYHSPEAALDDLCGGHTFSLPGNLDSSTCGLPEELGEWDRQGGQNPRGRV